LLRHLLGKHLNNSITFITFTLLSSLFFGCGSEEAMKQLGAEERYELGMKAFRNEDYLAAIEDFKIVSLQYQGSMVADSAQFFMAESRYLREEYILAAFEYDVLIRTMPSSNLVARSRFRRATCYYELSPNAILDQNYSRKAIDEYQAFLEYHPTDTLVSLAEKRINELNTKLALKDFGNGMTYMHMEYYKAATYYFDVVLDKYHDTQYAEPALLKKAEALSNRKKYTEAKEALEKFKEKYPASALKSDADKLNADIEAGLRSEKTKKPKMTEPIKDTSKQVLQPGS
jgi:outer membrane protein assembly factor BamD